MAKILIASPHEGERYRMVDVLKSDDHMCIACADGKSAQEVLANDLPDLVIADVDLPGLDAFAATMKGTTCVHPADHLVLDAETCFAPTRPPLRHHRSNFPSAPW